MAIALAVDGDAAAVPVDQVLDDGQPEAEPAARGVGRAVGLHERLEDPRQLRAGNAAAVVAHGHPHTPGQLLDRHFDAPLGRRELRGVRQQVAEYLRQTHQIALHGYALSAGNHERVPVAHDQRRSQLHGSFEHRAERDWLALQLDVTAGDSRNIEQIID